jgi:ATP-binding cassette subfamily B protein
MKSSTEITTLPSKLTPFIWRYLKNRKMYLAGFLFIGLIWAIEMTLSPYLLKVIIDSVVRYPENQAKMLAAVLIPAIIYFSMTIVMNLIFRLHDYLNLHLFPEIYSAMNKDMFVYLMRHSYTFFQNNFAGSLTKKIFDICQNVERIISTIKVAVFPRILAMIISSVTLFTVVQPIFGMILFAWTIVFVVISYVVAKSSEKIARENAEASAKLGGAMSDSVSNIVSTKIFANMDIEAAYLDKYINAMVKSDRKLLWKNLKANFIHGCFVSLLVGSMLIALIQGRMHGTVSPGDFALVLMLSISYIMSLEDIRQRMLEFTKVVGNCNQALSFIRINHEIIDAPNALPIHIKAGTIQFENVSFQHENSNNILFDTLNVTIKPGEKVGLVGYSGGGKSTFIKLILRLIDTQSGRVLIDDQDVKQVTKHSLRKQVSTIPQEPDLFHRSIMENIRFAKPEASDAEVIAAAKKARCDEFISELPDGYESLVGERGIKLSGGQKQRIAIARAFLKNASILLLDEATSSLDSITERYIQESLHDVMANKTTIVIAHRLSTLKDMDRILVFVHGEIVEDGSLESLLKDTHGHFYKLWQMQAEGFIPSISE